MPQKDIIIVVMDNFKNKYAMAWNDHAKNFSISLFNLLEQKELVDVTLVADGYLFSAHRLVLATLSPYFRQMFSQMPTNQQAFGIYFNWPSIHHRIILHFFL